MTNHVNYIKRSLGLKDTKKEFKYKKLLSIHLQSNDPLNFSEFIKSLEKNVENIDLIEVVVKIDDNDQQMNTLLEDLVNTSIVSIKYVSTPLLGDFSDLWRSMNDMLLICEKDTYFVWNMNDEMRIPIQGWDKILMQYVDMFPDALFRLRTSRFRYRNYSEPWECCFAPETSAITTKKWIDTCGDWNPTLGPDTFNQLVAYYFSYHDRFNGVKETRDIIINDFIFEGEGASLGYNKKEVTKRLFSTTASWFELVSYKTQLEASRRSQLIKAQIYKEKNYINSPEYKDIRITQKNKNIIIKLNNTVLSKFPYKLSIIKIVMGNFIKSLQYFKYGGGGKDYRKHTFGAYTQMTIENIKLLFYTLILRYKLQKTYEFLRLYTAFHKNFYRKNSNINLYKFAVLLFIIIPLVLYRIIITVGHIFLEYIKILIFLNIIMKKVIREIINSPFKVTLALLYLLIYSRQIFFYLIRLVIITVPLYLLKTIIIDMLLGLPVKIVAKLYLNISKIITKSTSYFCNAPTNKITKVTRKNKVFSRLNKNTLKIFNTVRLYIEAQDSLYSNLMLNIEPKFNLKTKSKLDTYSKKYLLNKKLSKNLIRRVSFMLIYAIFNITKSLIVLFVVTKKILRIIINEFLISPLKILYILSLLLSYTFKIIKEILYFSFSNLTSPRLSNIFAKKNSLSESRWQAILLYRTVIDPHTKNIFKKYKKIYYKFIYYRNFFLDMKENAIFDFQHRFNFIRKYKGNTDATNFFNKINYLKILPFLYDNNILANKSTSKIYVEIVLLCRFYKIDIDSIYDRREEISSLVVNSEHIFNNFAEHKSRINHTNYIFKTKFNYDLRAFIK